MDTQNDLKMLDMTLLLLNEEKGQFSELAREAAVSEQWIRSVWMRRVDDPGVAKIESLLKVLKRRQGERMVAEYLKSQAGHPVPSGRDVKLSAGSGESSVPAL